MCGSHPPAGEDTAEIQCVKHLGILEGEECLDDLRSFFQSEVQVWEPAFLDKGGLCEYSGIERSNNQEVYTRARECGSDY